MNRRSWRALLALLLAIALIGAACDSDDDGDEAEPDTPTDVDDGDGAVGDDVAPDVPTVEVTASEEAGDDGKTYSFSAPESVTAGATRLDLTNTGEEPHHLQVFRVNDDATIDDVGAQLATGDPAALLEVGTFDGGTATTDPFGGQSQADAIVDLDEGQYVFMCFIPDAEGVPHVANGMFQPFEVTAAEDDAASVPEADATVQGHDFTFAVPELSAGTVVGFENASETQAHEVNVIRLAEGASVDDVTGFFDALEGEGAPADEETADDETADDETAEEGDAAAAQGPPPFSSVGGIQAILPGASQNMAFAVEPGEYVFICLIPDPTDGVPHYQKGMVQQVTVS